MFLTICNNNKYVFNYLKLKLSNFLLSIKKIDIILFYIFEFLILFLLNSLKNCNFINYFFIKF
jgi:hypothetical protein